MFYDWDTNGAQRNTGISYARSEISFSKISDGMSHTYLAGEKYLPPAAYTTGIDPADNHGMYEGCAVDTYRWCDYFDPQAGIGRTPLQDRDGIGDFSRFGSPHAAGCHFVMGDGSVQAISYSVDPQIHAHLGNRHDGKTIDSGRL